MSRHNSRDMGNGISGIAGFGGEDKRESPERYREKRSPTKETPSHNTRSHKQSSPTRDAPSHNARDHKQQSPTRKHGGSSSGNHVESMDCEDPYANNVHGASSGQSSYFGGSQGQYGSQGQSQSGNSWQQHGGYYNGHSGQSWQYSGGHMQHHQPGFGAGQAQAQGHMFRNAQASKQMVYEVYGNCLAMLEELESRELKCHRQQPLPRSGIPMPSQSQHDDSTVQRKLETQLLLFQSQLSSCDKEIKEEVRDELKQNTLVWNGQRESRGLPGGVTDKYAGKLYEVLERGKTEHPKEFYQQPSIDQAGMQRAMQGIVQGNHMRAQLDDDFKKNPKKKAEPHKVRSGAGMDKGAERLARNNPDLEHGLGRYRSTDLK